MASGDINAGYVLQNASVLDVPFIFELMMEGSQRGAFSDSFLSGTGSLQLFLIIFIGVLLRRAWPRRFGLRASWLIVTIGKEALGFMRVVTLQQTAEQVHKEVSFFALDPRYRGKGHGKKVLQLFIRNLGEGSTVVAYCTKYSRPMQKILKAGGFTRNPKSGYSVEEYRLVVQNRLFTPAKSP